MAAPVTLTDPHGKYVDISSGGGGGGGEVEVKNWPSVQPVSGTVSVGNWPATQAVSGTVSVSGIAGAGSAGIGAVDATAYMDNTGAEDGTVIALLKGMYTQHVAMIILLEQIKENTTPATGD